MTSRRMVEAIDRIALRVLLVGLLLMAISAIGVAGQQVPEELTLEEAIVLAKAHNPGFLSTANDQASADWQVREAYAQFVPSVRTSLSGTWQEAGAQRFGAVIFEGQSTDWLYTGYSVNFGMTIDGNTVFGIPQARNNRTATAARIDAAEFNLESVVALQYMAVLRAMEGLDVAQRQLDRAQQNLQIVRTRVETGAAAGTEGRQAEVDLGRAEVALIQAERDLRQARLLLQEQVGVPIGEDVRLISGFEVFDPDFDVEELMGYAMEQHPSLRSFRAQESASRAAARQASTSQYLPSLSLSASLRGPAQEAPSTDYVLNQLQRQASAQRSNCQFLNALETGVTGGIPDYDVQDCSQFMVTPAMEQDALARNSAFPFGFEEVPMTMSLSISLPIFTGFSRERQVSQLNNQAEDAEHARRAEELRLRTMVTNTYDNLVSAYRVVQAEARNLQLSEEQLLLQQRRYALGASDLLLLMDAQTSVSTADQAYLNAVYDFHYNLIALEAAVGRPLRSR
ncbi:MAG: TolC family protein [Longimicrobiales bacterium]|nr:TolC family protein [Longimicrobiales bacterium]